LIDEDVVYFENYRLGHGFSMPKTFALKTPEVVVFLMVKSNAHFARIEIQRGTAHNQNPQPFVWPARASDILGKVTRAHDTLDKRTSG
jgi:hypothetical protein